MKKLRDLFYNQSLRFQLIFWFLLISVLPLIWMTYITYHISKDVILKEAETHLHVTGLKQINLLKAFFAEKERSASVLAKELIQPDVEEELDFTIKNYGIQSENYKQILIQLEPRLTEHTKLLDYRNFILIDDDGTVVLSMNKELIKPGLDLKEADQSENKTFLELFERTKSTMKPQLSPLTYFNPNDAPSIFISTPLTNKNNALFGVLMFQIDNAALFELVQNFQGIGNTGETLIAFDINSELIIFSSFYEKKRYPHIYRISPQSHFGQFVIRVLKGTPSIQYVQDYHGRTTIAVGKKVNPYTNWAIITKIDQNELLGTVNIIRYFSWILLLITAIIVTIIATYVAKKITHPILLLIQKTKLMAAGDLTQRIHIPHRNEMGKLGESFNEMAFQIDHLITHLDTLVAQRTQEVEHKNIQLNHTIEELKETQNRMVVQEKLASLGSLTAGIAHEIKNPLNFVNNFTELCFDIQKNLHVNLEKIESLIPADIKEECKEELETLKINLEKIYKHGKRADSIVHNMLQHSRGAPGEKTATDINKLLDEYVDLAFHGLRATDSTFNVKINKNYQIDLPKVIVSPQEMSRVFLNLLNNAFYAVNQRKKHAAANYQPIVEVSSKKIEDTLEISIWDNGDGIPENVLSKLFTPFFTTKPAGEGTGLGLSLSYNIIVQGHGGTLSVESQVNQYARFIILLPLHSTLHSSDE